MATCGSKVNSRAVLLRSMLLAVATTCWSAAVLVPSPLRPWSPSKPELGLRAISLVLHSTTALVLTLSLPYAWLGRWLRSRRSRHSQHFGATAKMSRPPTRPALPPPSADYSGRLVVVLDLDETLVSCQAAEDLPEWLRRDPPHGSALLDLPFARRDMNAQLAQPTRATARVQPVLVVQRPGLQEFLQRTSRFAELVLFTAATPEYAHPLISKLLDADGSLFQGRVLFRQHTACEHVPRPGQQAQRAQRPMQKICIKDLSVLGRDLQRVVLIDDNPVSCLRQPANAVPCLPFRGDPGDNHLLSVLLPLLQSLDLFPDVRPVLSARFKLQAWLEAKGYVEAAADQSPSAGAKAAVCDASAVPRAGCRPGLSNGPGLLGLALASQA